MLRLLMRNQNLQVVKVSFAVVAPRSLQEVLEARVCALLFPLRHCSPLTTGIKALDVVQEEQPALGCSGSSKGRGME